MIKAAVYCRVSTDKEDQANSFEAQKRFFGEYISRRPELELFDTYADEGLTGTSTKNRERFLRMIEDAERGCFGLIITKEVSRFSRNILDTIAYTRRLKACGVGVLFMSDGINSLDPDAELRLSIIGSIAQEESRRTSVRVKWGQTRQMERGVVFGHSMLGYNIKNGKIEPEPVGAELVRKIFGMYVDEGLGTTAISRRLSAETGGTGWTPSRIGKILKNEKYVGDLVQKKTVTPDYLTHVRKYNHGEEAFVVIRDHHEPLIDRELWTAAQRRLSENRGRTVGSGNRYIFSGKIVCGECGAAFIARNKYHSDGSRHRRWGCGSAARGRNCGIGKMLRDEDALEMLRSCIRSLKLDCNAIASDVKNAFFISRRVIAPDIDSAIRKKEALIDAYLSGLVNEDEFRHMKSRYDSLIAEKKLLSIAACEQQDIYSEILKVINCETDTAAFYRALVERVTVYKDGSVTYKLKNLSGLWIFEQKEKL